MIISYGAKNFKSYFYILCNIIQSLFKVLFFNSENQPQNTAYKFRIVKNDNLHNNTSQLFSENAKAYNNNRKSNYRKKEG